MNELFLDTSTHYLLIAYYIDNNLKCSLIKNHERLHTEKSPKVLYDFLKKNKILLSNVKKIYTTNGPGSFVGTRVASTIIKMIKIIYPNIEIYTANTLEFQRLFNKNKTSLLQASKNLCYLLINTTSKLIVNKNDNYDYENFTEIETVIKKFPIIKKYFVLNNDCNINYLENK